MSGMKKRVVEEEAKGNECGWDNEICGGNER